MNSWGSEDKSATHRIVVLCLAVLFVLVIVLVIALVIVWVFGRIASG